MTTLDRLRTVIPDLAEKVVEATVFDHKGRKVTEIVLKQDENRHKVAWLMGDLEAFTDLEIRRRPVGEIADMPTCRVKSVPNPFVHSDYDPNKPEEEFEARRLVREKFDQYWEDKWPAPPYTEVVI